MMTLIHDSKHPNRSWTTVQISWKRLVWRTVTLALCYWEVSTFSWLSYRLVLSFVDIAWIELPGFSFLILNLMKFRDFVDWKWVLSSYYGTRLLYLQSGTSDGSYGATFSHAAGPGLYDPLLHRCFKYVMNEWMNSPSEYTIIAS